MNVPALEKDVLSVLFSQEEIDKRTTELGQQISAFYNEQGVTELTVVGVLRGSVPFLSDLIRKMDIPLTIDFIDAKSYGDGTVSKGTVRIMKDLVDDIHNRHVLIIEDIIDTGRTLQLLCNMLWQRQPASLHLCTFLDKPSRRVTDLKPDFYGFSIPDHFVVGYGLDYSGKYRQLPYVAVLKPEAYGEE